MLTYEDSDSNTPFNDPNLNWKSENSSNRQINLTEVSPNTVGSLIENTDTGELVDLDHIEFSNYLSMPVEPSISNLLEDTQPKPSASCLKTPTNFNDYQENLSTINISGTEFGNAHTQLRKLTISEPPFASSGSPLNESDIPVQPVKVRCKRKQGNFLHMKNDPNDFRAIRAKKQKEIRDKHKEEMFYLQQIKQKYEELKKSSSEREKSNDEIIQRLTKDANEAREKLAEAREELAEVRQSESLLKEQIMQLQTGKLQYRLTQQQKDAILKKTKEVSSFFSSPGDTVRLSSSLEQVCEEGTGAFFPGATLKTDVTISLQIDKSL